MIFWRRYYLGLFVLVALSFSIILFIHYFSTFKFCIDTTMLVHPLWNTTKCSARILEFHIVQKEKYTILYNYVQAEESFDSLESITLTAPGDFRFLDNVVPLVKRWQGPISVALYAPGHDFFSTLSTIAYLRKCTIPDVKKLVTFHIFFETKHMPQIVNCTITDYYEDYYNCSNNPFLKLNESKMYKMEKNLLYPINVARNIAKEEVQTHFIFPSDIELYPSSNFIKKFLNFASSNPQHFMTSKKVFVLPVFEVDSNEVVPENKTDLLKMIREKKAFPFHYQLCRSCHEVINGKEWRNAEETTGLSVFAEGKRHGIYSIWEPFYVTTQREPNFDERLSWEGQGNKMSQAFTLCLMDFDFAVLDNAFLVHKPGIKKKKKQVELYSDIVRKTNKFLNETVIKELQQLYGRNVHCRLI